MHYRQSESSLIILIILASSIFHDEGVLSEGLMSRSGLCTERERARARARAKARARAREERGERRERERERKSYVWRGFVPDSPQHHVTIPSRCAFNTPRSSFYPGEHCIMKSLMFSKNPFTLYFGI